LLLSSGLVRTHLLEEGYVAVCDIGWGLAPDLVLIGVFALMIPGPIHAVEDWAFYGPDDCENNVGDCAGRTLAVLQDPTDDDVVYIGHSSGGLWKTSNRGASWAPVMDGAIGALAYRATSGKGLGLAADRVLAGTGEWTDYQSHVGGTGIYYSENDGSSWMQGLSFDEGDHTNVCAIAVDAGGNIALAGTTDGLYRSTNGGTSWTGPHSTFSDAEVCDVTTHPSIASIALAAVNRTPPGITKGLYRTSNGGVSWTYVSEYLFEARDWPWQSRWGRTMIAWSQSNPDSVYCRVIHNVPANPGDSRNGSVICIAASGDAGATWSILFDEDVDTSSPLYALNGAEGRSSFGVDKHDSQYLLTGGVTLYRSRDGGANWTYVSTGSPAWSSYHPDVHYVEPAEAGLWVATDGGVSFHIPVDGEPYPADSMSTTNNGYYTLQFYGLEVDPTSGDLVYGGTQDQGTWAMNESGPGGDDWDRIGGADGYEIATSDSCHNCITSTSGSDVVFHWVNSGLRGSCDAGVTSTYLGGGSHHGPIFVDPHDEDDIVWFFRRHELWNVDYADDCEPIKRKSITWHRAVRSADMASNLPRRFYAGTDSAQVWIFVQDQHGVFTTTELSTGSPWDDTGFDPSVNIDHVEVVTGASPEYDVVYVTMGLASGMDPAQRVNTWSSAYDRTGGNVWRYDAYTDTWGSASNGLPQGPVLAIEVDPGDSDILYAGTLHGVWWTHDGGDDWHPIQYNLPDVMIRDLVLHPGTRALYASTHGRSIWRAYPDNWPYYEEGRVAPSEDGLWRARSGHLTRGIDGIAFRVETGGEVRVDLYDVQGRHIRTLFERRVEPGQYSANEHLDALPPGIYFSQLRIDGTQVDAMKVVAR
jgi:hypothetical protein